MNTRTLILISCSCALIGALLFAFSQGWIIIQSPSSTKTVPTTSGAITKKKVTLYYWHHNSWKRESVDLLWADSAAQTLEYLANAWLTLLDEENIMPKKIIVQSVLMTQSGHAYISFDRYPFEKEHATTHDKLLWIEGLLKTIRENGINIQSVQFLVNHQPLNDPHLDFSNPWPLRGFLE